MHPGHALDRGGHHLPLGLIKVIMGNIATHVLRVQFAGDPDHLEP
jgi:hypothetical protein